MKDETIDHWLSHELKKINSQLPRNRAYLQDLLKTDQPYVETVGGGKHFFSVEELELLARSLPKEIGSNLSLPIVFIRRYEMGEGVYTFEGDSEAEAFKNILGLSYLSKTEKKYHTYKPVVIDFLRRFKTIAVVSFL